MANHRVDGTPENLRATWEHPSVRETVKGHREKSPKPLFEPLWVPPDQRRPETESSKSDTADPDQDETNPFKLTAEERRMSRTFAEQPANTKRVTLRQPENQTFAVGLSSQFRQPRIVKFSGSHARKYYRGQVHKHVNCPMRMLFGQLPLQNGRQSRKKPESNTPSWLD